MGAVLRSRSEGQGHVPIYDHEVHGEDLVALLDYVAAIEAPALVLLGIETHAAWSMAAERMAECLPNATLELVPGANHRGPATRPEAIARSIPDFVDADGRTR